MSVNAASPNSKHNAVPPEVLRLQPLVWENPRRRPALQALKSIELALVDVFEAQQRWRRFAPLLAKLFPETAGTAGHIDSELLDLDPRLGLAPKARILVKADHSLPVTGCIKARGGVYEILAFAESLASANRLLLPEEDAGELDRPEVKAMFAKHKIIVGSTGNLGFSVGVMARALGFKAEVHMSRDAKEWKKERLRHLGVDVVEHAGDYTRAVASARTATRADPQAYFVDDEDSVSLFLGYAVAALDLKRQLEVRALAVDVAHPLIVYLPCGVGGAPGGIVFGLKLLFGDAVVCALVEPVGAPCMLVQLAAGTQEPAPLAALGLECATEADGLAVAAASMFVARTIEGLADACITCTDEQMFHWTGLSWNRAGLRLEPSAAVGFCAAALLLAEDNVTVSELRRKAMNPNATHVIWTTGGSHLPEAEFQSVLARSFASRSSSGD